MKKLTYEFVKEQFENEGYELLSEEYVTTQTKLKYICPEGHEHNVTWSSWQQGNRCPYCSGKAKKTIEFIRAEFEKDGYNLLTKVYKNAHQKLKYICPKGHKHSIIWNSWQRGHRCPYCTGLGKPTIKFIRSEFEKEGYTLLTQEYENNRQKLEYICPQGHKHSIGWSSWWFQKCRCPFCAKKAKKSIDFIRSEFAKEGYKLLTEVYINTYQKLNYICPKGHEHSITWSNWVTNHRCPTCFFVKNSGPGNPNWKGGIACEPYCDAWADKEYKESIKEQDNYQCQNPDCWGTSKALVIHHIDYVKKHCDPGNLITLCNSCNIRANKDREWHTSYYEEIVRRRNLDNEL